MVVATGTRGSRAAPHSRTRPRAASRRTSVVIEEPTQARSTANPANAIRGRRAGDEFVPESLVIPYQATELKAAPRELNRLAPRPRLGAAFDRITEQLLHRS